MREFYSQQDVQEILKLAIARQVESDNLTRQQLLEVADEMGIEPVDLQVAEQQWLLHQSESSERLAFDQHRQGKFNLSFMRYGIISAFLLLIDIASGGGLSWSIFVCLFMGLPIALKAWKLYQLRGDDYEQAFQRWRHTRRLKRSVNAFLNRWLEAR